MKEFDSFYEIDFEAHRGGRGLMPENTIPAMLNAIDLNVKTLELDVHITKDKQVVVSHDPYFNPEITTTPEGTYLHKQEAIKRLLYSMDYDNIRKYDVGLKPYLAFPKQKKMAVVKPLLYQLIHETELYAYQKVKMMFYNIEIKSQPNKDNINHPEPKEFSELLIAVLKKKKILNRTIIQSFDVRPLQYIHTQYPLIKLSFLVENGNLHDQLSRLGFMPDIYSPAYKLVDKQLVKDCHQLNMKVLPWTVNSIDEMRSLIDMGVDGIISDYPDLFAAFL